jgi:hypothetical protein
MRVEAVFVNECSLAHLALLCHQLFAIPEEC